MNSIFSVPRTFAGVAGAIDHAILQPTATDAQMRADLEAVSAFPLASVCIKPYSVPLAAQVLAGTDIGVGTVIGFPHGTVLPEVKALETQLALAQGAREADMVINIGRAISGDWAFIREDIGAVLSVTRGAGALLKVIFETGLLPDDATKIRLCEICSELGVEFVKTSTGFGYVKGENGLVATGATVSDLRLMRAHSAPSVGVKASGGIRGLDDVFRALDCGATRIGTTSTLAILSQAQAHFSGGSSEAKSDADY